MADSEADLRVLARRARARFRRRDGHVPLQLLDEATRARSASGYAAELDRIRAMRGVTLLQP